MDDTKYEVELTLSQLMQIVEKNDNRVEICLGCKHVFHKKKMCTKCGAEYKWWDQDKCEACHEEWDWDNQKYIPCSKCKCESSVGSLDRYCGETRWQSILSAANITEADIAKGVVDLIHSKYKPYETSENNN